MSVVSRVVRTRAHTTADTERADNGASEPAHADPAPPEAPDDLTPEVPPSAITRWAPVAAASLALLLALGFLWQAWILKSPSFTEVSSRLFPLGVAVFLVAVTVWLLVSALIDVVRGPRVRAGDIGESTANMDVRCVAGFLAASVAFVVLFEPLGALLSVGLYMAAVSTLAAPKRWRRNVLAAIAVTVVFYLVFVLGFSVRLPELGGR